jgi:hypothetical protein
MSGGRGISGSLAYPYALCHFILRTRHKRGSKGVFLWAYRRNRNSQAHYRFKSRFAPDWEPQFFAAESMGTLLLSGLGLFRLIHAKPAPKETSPPAHDHYDDYQFDSSVLACEEAR